MGKPRSMSASVHGSDKNSGRNSGILDLSAKKGMRRCMSMPTTFLDVKSIMRCRTLDESLHSTYGSESGNGESKGNIKFKHVTVREYGRTVGDNPSCSSGPPVSISWDYNHLGSISLEDYENTRPPRRSQLDMVLPRKVRQDMLRREWDVTQRQIADSVRRNIKVKNQRKATVNNLGKATKMEEFMESAQRKLKRALTFQKPASAQVRDMEAKLNEVARRRQQLKLELQMAGEYGSISSVGGGDTGGGDDDDDDAGGESPETETPEAVDTSTSST